MWNIANKLTVLRMILVPVFVVLFMAPLVPQPWNRYFAFIIFALASYTDRLDGKLARERGLITNFGKFMDPMVFDYPGGPGIYYQRFPAGSCQPGDSDCGRDLGQAQNSGADGDGSGNDSEF